LKSAASEEGKCLLANIKLVASKLPVMLSYTRITKPSISRTQQYDLAVFIIDDRQRPGMRDLECNDMQFVRLFDIHHQRLSGSRIPAHFICRWNSQEGSNEFTMNEVFMYLNGCKRRHSNKDQS